MIHFSTDCVFSGLKGNYLENDFADANDIYGRSKFLGEISSEGNITIRTSFIGKELGTNRALLNWFLSQKEKIKGYRNAIYSGLTTLEIAKVLDKYVIPNPDLQGLYHLSADNIDKYSLLSLLNKVYKKNLFIEEDLNIRIDRSLNSYKFRNETGYKPLQWEQAIEEMREFGNEKNKLVLQPLGLLVLEFLLKHFDKLFDYTYTRNMETDLDLVAKGNKIWYSICRDCLDNIDECSKELKDDDRETIEIDENHVYMIAKYGPVIKKTVGETTSFLPVKKDIDINKLKNNQYQLSDLIEIKKEDIILGKYKKENVILKKGKYGNYITWGKDNKKSLNGIEKDIEELTIDDVIPLIENKVTLNPSIVRIINNESSIRKGKYGNYIFYQTHHMNKPKFIKLNGFKENYNTCPIENLEEFIEKNK